jgi:hypothetical protein
MYAPLNPYQFSKTTNVYGPGTIDRDDEETPVTMSEHGPVISSFANTNPSEEAELH